MKIFLAIDIPEEVKDSFEKQIQSLRLDYPYYSWIPKKNYLIDVNFLGDVEKSNVGAVQKRIQDVLYACDPFHMYSLEPGVHIDQRITLFLGFQRQKKLEEIESLIAGDIGAKQNYKYVPELTFAKWKIPSKQQYFHLKKKIDDLDIEIDFPVHHLTLYQSVTTSDTPTYIELAQLPLQQQ